MGWWGHGVMQGDQPLDIQYVIFDSLGIPELEDTPENNELIKKLLTDNQSELVDNAGEVDEDISIVHQVLAYIMMQYGVLIKEEVKAKLIDSINQDEWASEDRERMAEIVSFVKTLVEYDGTPKRVEYKGLFQVIGEKIASGEPGLVNVIPSQSNNVNLGDQKN